MIDIVVEKQKNNKKIMLFDNGKLVEYYEKNDNENKIEGNIFLGVVRNVVTSMAAGFIDIGIEKNAFIQVKDIIPQVDETKEKKIENDRYNISKIIKPGQRILVQVKKDSTELKGPRISKHITLPSKYIVFMPDTEIITISQKITEKAEQERLIKLVKENIGKNNGAVIRTSAIGKNQEIIDDINNVKVIWKKIQESAKNDKNRGAVEIYSAPSTFEKMLIDLQADNISSIITNDKKELEIIKKIINKYKELLHVKIECCTLTNIYEKYNVEKQIEKKDKRKIWLNCGGFITIDSTEALTAIDVNTGKFTEGNNYSDVIFKVNKYATNEIVKQIRLRDISGIIVIDYIDMNRKGDKEKIESYLKECLKSDRAKTQVEGFTKLDLMELTRKHIFGSPEKKDDNEGTKK